MKKVNRTLMIVTSVMVLSATYVNISNAGNGHEIFNVTTHNETDLKWNLIEHFDTHDTSLYLVVKPHEMLEKQAWIILNTHDSLHVSGKSDSAVVSCDADFNSNVSSSAYVTVEKRASDDYTCKVRIQ